MLSQRSALLWLILIEAATFARFSETVVFPAFIAVVAIIGWYGWWEYDLNHDQQVLRGLMLALVFAMTWRLRPYANEADIMEYLSPVLHALGQFLLSLQTAALFLKPPRGVLPVTLPWPGIFVMISAGDRRVSSAERVQFQLCAIAFVVMVALYFSATAHAASGRTTSRFYWGKLYAALFTMLFTGAVAWGAALALHRYERALDQIVSEFLPQNFGDSRAGFPSQSKLGNIMERKGEKAGAIALRVDGTSDPGYLRGKAYHWVSSEKARVSSKWRDDTDESDHEQLEITEWHSLPKGDDAQESSVKMTPQIVGAKPQATYRYRLDPATDTGRSNNVLAERPQRRVWLDESIWGICFVPPHATAVEWPDDSLHWDHRGYLSGSDERGGTYLYESGGPNTPETFFPLGWDKAPLLTREELTRLPESFRDDKEMQKIANEVFDGCRTPRDCMRAVPQYFQQQQFQYAVGIQIPKGVDPVRYFLEDRPPAHCEYFAQAAAALLRMRGIPTRYMTGFVVAEHNAIGNFWIARNEHAHAWCEAWDDELGWVIVEATPPAGVPQLSNATRSQQLWDSLTTQILKLRHGISHGGWSWVGQQLLAFVKTPAGWLLIGAILTYIGTRFWMRRTRGDVQRPEIELLHRMLRQMDRRIRRLEITRETGETLHRFASRLTAVGHPDIADWYQKYATVRYQPTIEEAELVNLRSRQQELLKRPSHRQSMISKTTSHAGSPTI